MSKSVPEIHERLGFDELKAQGQPVVIRDHDSEHEWVAQRWTPARLIDVLRRAATGAPVAVGVAPPEVAGRLGPTPEGKARNFEQESWPFERLANALLDELETRGGRTLYMQSEPIADKFPALSRSFELPGDIAPRIWLGTGQQIATHFDRMDNLARVFAGTRSVLLFPPDEIANLYPGPLEFTPAGAPVSMVRPDRPDLERYPLYQRALERSLTADLRPGDAIFIPHHWWHSFAASGFNILVNHWRSPVSDLAWTEAQSAFLQALLGLRDLPSDVRDAWAQLFDHYVFLRNGDPTRYVPEPAWGFAGPRTPERARRLRERILRLLAQTLAETPSEPQS